MLMSVRLSHPCPFSLLHSRRVILFRHDVIFFSLVAVLTYCIAIQNNYCYSVSLYYFTLHPCLLPTTITLTFVT
jgi:hypothetical protein